MRVILPILACVLCAGIILVTDSNKDGFLIGNAAAQWLPPSFWAGITTLGSVYGTFCLIASTLAWRPRWTATLLLTVPFGSIYTFGIKKWADMPRPAAICTPETFHVIDATLLEHSFPSGHTLTAFVAAGTVVFCSRQRLAWLALPVAMLVAFSRIAVGAHWPLDLLAGAAGGWATAAVGCALSAQWRFWENAHGQRILAGIALICVSIFFFEDTQYPRGAWMQHLLCVTCLLGASYALWRPAASSAQNTRAKPQ